MLNNYCRNCGKKLDLNEKYCTNCGAEVFEKRINIEEKKKELYIYKRKEKIYILSVIILISLYFLSVHFNLSKKYEFISFINSLLLIGSFIIIIYARITMCDSKKIRIMFNLFLAYLIYIMVLLLILIIGLNSLIRRC